MTAFVDILGFTELVRVTDTQRAAFEHVVLALRDVLRTCPPWDDPAVREQMWEQNREEFAKVGRQLTREEHSKMLDILQSRDRAFAFSDNVVRSSPADFPGVVSVCFSLVTLALRLLARGAFVRGGIALGKLYHDDSMVFGPALIEAYRLQQELAKYPRIVLSPAVAGLMYADPPYDTGIRPRDLMRITLPEGLPYLHFLSEHAISGAGFADGDGVTAVTAIRTQLTGKLEVYGKWSPSIQEKFRWFVDYFNETVDSGSGVLGIKRIEGLPWRTG